MDDLKEYEGFCTHCRFRIKSFKNLDKCPNCETKSIPCSSSDQVNISINWQELRILCHWAGKYGRKIDSQGVIYGIVHDIEKQHPDKTTLTFSGEFNELKKKFPNAKLTNSDGKDIPT